MQELNVCEIYRGEKRTVINPDFFRMFNQRIEIGQRIVVPLIRRKNEVALWETGGRRRIAKNSKTTTSSFATIIASDKDSILNAIIFDKYDKKPNNRQALMNIREGYNVYTGKMSIKRGSLAPFITIFRLVYLGDDASYNENFEFSDRYYLGLFEVADIFTGYERIAGNIPAERLVTKLYTYDVIKPFYANGWNISNQPCLPENVDPIKNNIQRLLDIPDQPDEKNANKFIDNVENSIVSLRNEKLSAVLHYINFETSMMRIVVLKDLDMKNIKDSIDSAEPYQAFKISLNDIKNCYNQHIIFRSDDMPMLEVTLNHDDNYSMKIGTREHVILRAWRG